MTQRGVGTGGQLDSLSRARLTAGLAGAGVDRGEVDDQRDWPDPDRLVSNAQNLWMSLGEAA